MTWRESFGTFKAYSSAGQGLWSYFYQAFVLAAAAKILLPWLPTWSLVAMIPAILAVFFVTGYWYRRSGVMGVEAVATVTESLNPAMVILFECLFRLLEAARVSTNHFPATPRREILEAMRTPGARGRSEPT